MGFIAGLLWVYCRVIRGYSRVIKGFIVRFPGGSLYGYQGVLL